MILLIAAISLAQGEIMEQTLPMLEKDPFDVLGHRPCEELKVQYFADIDSWQWRGFIVNPTHHHNASERQYLQLWLVNTKQQWVKANLSNKTVLGLSWTMMQIHKQYITWQIALPIYCAELLTYQMPFAGH